MVFAPQSRDSSLLENCCTSFRPVHTVGRPAVAAVVETGVYWSGLRVMPEHLSHASDIHVQAALVAFGTALLGFLLATAFYGVRILDAEDVRRQFRIIYEFLLNKWWFDELYDRIFMRPTHVVSGWISWIDRSCIARLVDGLAAITRRFATFWAWLADQMIVDGFVDGLASRTYALGLSLRAVQTGRIRQYVMFIVIGLVAIFILISFFWNPTLAG